MKPLPESIAFALSDKKRTKTQIVGNPRGFTPIPNTPMKRSQTDEERTQQERYDAELSYRYSSKIPLGSTKTSTVFRVTDTMATPYALKELNHVLLSKKRSNKRPL